MHLWTHLIRGLAVSGLALLSFVGVCFVFAAPVGFSRWDLAFVALLGLVAAPTAFAEEAARRRKAAGVKRLAWTCAIGLLAAVGFAMSYLQISYVYSLTNSGSLLDALGGVGQGGEKMAGMWSETRTLLCAFAAPFALTAWTRLGGLSLKAQVGLTAAGSLVIFSLSLRGFAGLPIVGWLAGSAWAHPIVGTYVYLNPLIFGIALPLLAAALDPEDTPNGGSSAP